jgi:hypothetical protein
MIDMSDPLERDIDERMRALTPDAYRRLGVRPPEPPAEVVVKVAAPPSDDQIASVLGNLLCESFVEAQRSFKLARQSGESVELRDIFINQATRLAGACADMVEALAKHRGKGQQRIVVQHLHGGSQAVGMVNEGEPR